MGLFHNLTRGGQVHIHQIRMIRQVLWFGTMVSFCSGVGYFAVKTYGTVPSWAWQTLWEYHVAELNVATQPDGKKAVVTQVYVPPRGRPFVRRSLSILTDRAIVKTVTVIEQWFYDLFWKSLRIGFWAFFVSLGGWALMGWHHRRKRPHRGNTLVSPKTLARKLRWTFKASDLKLGKLPLVKGSETRHILISGTTGSGKTNAFHTLLPQIRQRGDRAIVIDVEGSLVRHYYREGRDILLNPFDARSESWDLWQELESEPLYEVFAHAVIPSSSQIRDPLWENAARKILMAALKKLKEQGNPSPQDLYDLLVYSIPSVFETFFQQTEAATFSQEKGEKFTLSVRASLEQHVNFFKYLRDDQGGQKFSLRRWVQSGPADQWLFLTCRQDWMKAMRPLLSGWTELASSALMSLNPDPHRRLWFVLDELPALNALPCLFENMSRARKYGGCVLAGVQNFKQLGVTYGRSEAEVLLDLFNTKVFFRNGEADTADWVSRSLGEQEETEVVENLSYGANTMRDGVSLNQQTKRTPLVLPTEITMLKDLEAFVKLPGSYPVTRFRFPLQKPATMAESFEERPPQDQKKDNKQAEDNQAHDAKPAPSQEKPPISKDDLADSSEEPNDPALPEEKGQKMSTFIMKTSQTNTTAHPLSEDNEQEDTPLTSDAPRPFLKSLPLGYSTENHQKNQEESPQPDPALVLAFSILEKVETGIRERYQNVLRLLLKEAERGRIYTASSFALRFEGLGTFGSSAGLLEILKALSAKNIVKYFINGEDYGFEHCKKGYIWIPGMKILRPDLLDERDGEVFSEPEPTHYRDPHTGSLRKIQEEM